MSRVSVPKTLLVCLTNGDHQQIEAYKMSSTGSMAVAVPLPIPRQVKADWSNGRSSYNWTFLSRYHVQWSCDYRCRWFRVVIAEGWYFCVVQLLPLKRSSNSPGGLSGGNFDSLLNNPSNSWLVTISVVMGLWKLTLEK